MADFKDKWNGRVPVIFRKTCKYTLNNVRRRDVFEQDLRSLGYCVNGEEITAMAYTRKQALRKLEELHLKITEHVLRLVLWPQSTDASHWKIELDAWKNTLIKYNRGKQKSGVNYCRETLEEWLWENPLGTEGDRNTSLKCLAGKYPPVCPTSLTSEQVTTLKAEIDSYIDDVLA